MTSVAKLGKQADGIVDMVVIVAIGLVFLGKMAMTSGIGTSAQTAINSAVTGLDDYIDWIGLIILIGVIVYLRSARGGSKEG